MLRIMLALWAVLLSLLELSKADVTTMTDKIIKDILTDYNPDARPGGQQGVSGIQVGLNLVPLHVHINAELSTLSSHVWFVMKWKDSRLQWMPANYENVSVIHLSPSRVWKPDIMVYNSVEHYDYELTDLILVSNGELWWVPPVNLHTNCELNWTYWPWDKQVCKLVVGSWTKTGWELDITNLNGENITAVDKENFVPGAWDIASGQQTRQVVSEYGGPNDYFVELQVQLILVRRSFLDRKVAVMPLLVASCFLLATFWSHPASSARLRLNIASCVILIITLLALRSMLPAAGGQAPLVVIFNTGLLVLGTVQLILVISLGNLVARSDSPSTRILLPLQTIAPFLCLGNIPLIGQVPSVTPPWAPASDTVQLESGLPKLTGWNLVAQAIDRVAFLVYILIIFLFLVSYLGSSSTVAS